MRIALVLVCLMARVAWGEESSGEIARLVREMGAEDVVAREAAVEKLVNLGEAARAALLEAEKSPDAEIRGRAAGALIEIRRRAILSRIGKGVGSVPCRGGSGHAGYFRGGLGEPLPTEKPQDAVVFFMTDESAYGKRDSCLHAVETTTHREIWSKPIGKPAWSPPVIFDGILLLAGTDGCVYALSARTGQELWNSDVATQHIGASPVYGEGKVFFGAYDSTFYALDARTGALSWNKAFAKPIGSAALVARGLVYTGSLDGSLHALDAETGEERWKVSTGSHVLCDPVLHAGAVYFTSWDGSLYAADAQSGEKLWSVRTGKGFSAPGYTLGLPPDRDENAPEPEREGVICAPVIEDGVVYAPTTSGLCFAWDAKTGEEIWKVEFEGDVRRAPALGGGNLFFGSRAPPRLYSLEAKTGKLRWKFATDGAPFFSPALHAGVVYVGTKNNLLLAIDADSGKELWRIETQGPVGAPAIAD